MVVIGGDSAGVAGQALTVRGDTKVFTRGAYVFGFTTSFRMGQLLRYTGSLSEPSTWDVDAFMVQTFIPEVRTILRDGGWLLADRGVESGGTFLVGIRGRLYRVDGDFQIGRSVDGYDACGCGQELARGALHASRTVGDPQERVRMALDAAAHHSAGVAEPFHLVAL